MVNIPSVELAMPLPYMKLTGFPAWLLRSCVHLLLVGLRNRVLVYVQWVWAWLFHARGVRLMDTGVAGLRKAARGEKTTYRARSIGIEPARRRR
jgi:hypothetical protein